MLRQWLIRIVENPGIVRSVPIGSPIALECASGDIKNSDALIAIAVCNVCLVGCRVDGNFGNLIEVCGAVAVDGLSWQPNLTHEVTSRRKH